MHRHLTSRSRFESAALAVPARCAQRLCMRQIVVRLTVVVILAVVTWRAGAGQTYVDRGYQIKAAYLYNFAKYVRWPDRFELT